MDGWREGEILQNSPSKEKAYLGGMNVDKRDYVPFV